MEGHAQPRLAVRAARVERRWRLAALVLGAFVLSIGCNPLATFSFIFEPDHMVAPKCPIACDGKEVKVVIQGKQGAGENRHAQPAEKLQELAPEVA